MTPRDDENTSDSATNIGESDSGSKASEKELDRLENKPAPPQSISIKVTDNQNELSFIVNSRTPMSKVMTAFCNLKDRNLASLRFLFDGQRVQPDDTPTDVRLSHDTPVAPKALTLT